MNRRILILFISILVSFGFAIPSFAAQIDDDVIDQSFDEESEISVELDLKDYILQEGGLSAYPSKDYSSEELDLLSGSEELDINYAVTDKDAIKEYIYQCLLNRDTYIYLYREGYIITLDEVNEYVYEIFNAYPELFFAEINSYSDNGRYVTYYKARYKDGYDFEKFDEEVRKALSVVTPQMSDMEKIIAIHEYLVLDCEYDYARLNAGTLKVSHPDAYNAYGVLVDKQAVCNGYALAYMYLMNKLGIHTVIVSSEQVNHAWNMVYLDGYWYEIDCTWDDPAWDTYGRVRHRDLLCSDVSFSSGHRASDWVIRDNGAVVTNISATSTKYDNAFWKNEDFVSQLINHDGYFYYSTHGNFINVINKVRIDDYNGDDISTIYSNIPIWKPWNDNTRYYATSYSSLEEVDDRLVYTTPTTINSINFDGTDNKVIYTLPTGALGYIYGGHIKNGQMYIVISTSVGGGSAQTLTPVNVVYPATSRKVEQASLNLNDIGIISLQFYISNLDGSEIVYIDGEGYTVSDRNKVSGEGFTGGSRDNAGDLHVFSCDIPAKEIYRDIEVKLVQASNPSKVLKLSNTKNAVNGVLYYSVSDYLDEVIGNPAKYDSKLVDACDALLTYGDNAKAYFDGTTSSRTSKRSIYPDFDGVDPLAQYDMKFIGDDSLRDRFIGASLVLSDSISLKMYYKDDSAKGYSSRIYSGFSAHQIDDYFSSSFDGGAYKVQYGPFSYIKRARDLDSNPKLIQLLEALYGYWYYSDVYFSARYGG